MDVLHHTRLRLPARALEGPLMRHGEDERQFNVEAPPSRATSGPYASFGRKLPTAFHTPIPFHGIDGVVK